MKLIDAINNVDRSPNNNGTEKRLEDIKYENDSKKLDREIKRHMQIRRNKERNNRCV
jgi:hypothetical protein